MWMPKPTDVRIKSDYTAAYVGPPCHFEIFD